MQNGGCHPVDGCQDGTPFFGSLFQYLAANVLYAGTQNTILPAYEIKKFGNAKIAFIGLTLEGTPLIVTPAGVAGLDFAPEVLTVNRLVKTLREERGRPRDRRPDPRGRAAERAVRRRLHGHQPLRQLHRRDQADRRGPRPAGRPRRLGAHASAVHLQVQRHPDHERRRRSGA